MEVFKKIVQKYQKLFIQDGTISLISRLKHTVFKFGLKKINISYSQIYLNDIKKKL